MCVCICVCGSVTLMNMITALPEHGTTCMQKCVIGYAHSEIVYLMFSHAINLKKGKADI